MASAPEGSSRGYCTWRFVDGDWVAENHCTAGNQCAAKVQKLATDPRPRMHNTEFRGWTSDLGIAIAANQEQVTVPCISSGPNPGTDPTGPGDV